MSRIGKHASLLHFHSRLDYALECAHIQAIAILTMLCTTKTTTNICNHKTLTVNVLSHGHRSALTHFRAEIRISQPRPAFRHQHCVQVIKHTHNNTYNSFQYRLGWNRVAALHSTTVEHLSWPRGREWRHRICAQTH